MAMETNAQAIYNDLTVIVSADERAYSRPDGYYDRADNDSFHAQLKAHGCVDLLSAEAMKVNLQTARELKVAATAYRDLRTRLFSKLTTRSVYTLPYAGRGLRLDAAIEGLRQFIARLEQGDPLAWTPRDDSDAASRDDDVLKGSRSSQNTGGGQVTPEQMELIRSYAEFSELTFAASWMDWSAIGEERFVCHRLEEMTSPNLAYPLESDEQETLPALEAADRRARDILRIIEDAVPPPAVTELRAAPVPPDWYVETVSYGKGIDAIMAWAVSDAMRAGLADDPAQRAGMPADRMVVVRGNIAWVASRLRALGYTVLNDDPTPNTPTSARVVSTALGSIVVTDDPTVP